MLGHAKDDGGIAVRRCGAMQWSLIQLLVGEGCGIASMLCFAGLFGWSEMLSVL